MKLTNQNQDHDIEDFEKDYLIINLTRRYVMSLEVKSTLTTNALKSAKKQIDGSKLFIDEWIGATFTKENGWTFLGVMCFEDLSPKYSPEIVENLNKSGSAENIELWRCWTPNQLPLLKSKVKKVMFINAPSTG